MKHTDEITNTYIFFFLSHHITSMAHFLLGLISSGIITSKQNLLAPLPSAGGCYCNRYSVSVMYSRSTKNKQYNAHFFKLIDPLQCNNIHHWYTAQILFLRWHIFASLGQMKQPLTFFLFNINNGEINLMWHTADRFVLY